MSAALAKIEAKLKGYDDPWIGRPHPPPQGGCHMTSSGGPLVQARAMVGQAPHHKSSRLPSKIKWVFPLNSCRFQNRHTEPRFDWSDLPTSFAHLPHFASLVSTHARGNPCSCSLPVALNVRRWREMRSVQHTHSLSLSLGAESALVERACVSGRVSPVQGSIGLDHRPVLFPPCESADGLDR